MSKLVVFIDESGIHKIQDHSCFAVVYIQVKNIDEIEKAVLNIENKLNIKFHWAHTVWSIKEKFFDEISKLDFSAKVAVIKNPVNMQNELEDIFKHLIIEKDIKKIVIDGKKSAKYERRLKKVMRDKNLSVRKIKTVNDESFAGIRLADAVAGAVRSYYDNLDGKTKKLYDKIKTKILITLQK